jgi:hypothetical protein
MIQTRVLLLLMLITSNLPVTCAQNLTSEVPQKKTEKYQPNWIGKFLFSGLVAAAIVYCSNASNNHLDSTRPFTCARITHTFKVHGSPNIGITNDHVCAHTEKPFGLTQYKYVDRNLMKKCVYPNIPSVPTWALPGEIESLKLTEIDGEQIENTLFTLTCRYDPK